MFTIPNDVARVNQGVLKTGTNANITTDLVLEGSQLYYTDQRVNALLNT